MPMFIRVHQYFECLNLNNQNLKGLLDGLLGLPSWPDKMQMNQCFHQVFDHTDKLLVMHERVVKTGLPLKNKGTILTRICEDTLLIQFIAPKHFLFWGKVA
jgi:hypothetical protein